MRAGALTFLAIAAIAGTCATPGEPLAQAQESSSPVQLATSGVVVGTDFSVLEFDADPDADGLIATFGDPAIRTSIPVAILNTSDQPVTNLRFFAEALEGGVVIGHDPSVWIYPMTIGPGGFGFGEIDLEHGVMAGDDAQFALKRIPPADNAAIVVDLPITAYRVFGDQVTGTVENPHSHDVAAVEIHSLCVEDSGVVLAYAFHIIDRREIEAGTAATFEADLPGDSVWGDDCSDQELFFTAIGQVA